jgi:hypothetical protein
MMKSLSGWRNPFAGGHAPASTESTGQASSGPQGGGALRGKSSETVKQQNAVANSLGQGQEEEEDDVPMDFPKEEAKGNDAPEEGNDDPEYKEYLELKAKIEKEGTADSKDVMRFAELSGKFPETASV